MSVNIKIELPAATIVAIQKAAKGGEVEAIRTVRALTDRAVLDAVQELPYDLIPKDEVLKKPAKPHSQKRSLESIGTIGATDSRKQRKLSTSFQIFVKTNSGKTITIDVTDRTTIDDIKSNIAHREGTPPDHQRLLFSGRQMRDGKTITEVSHLSVNSFLLLT